MGTVRFQNQSYKGRFDLEKSGLKIASWAQALETLGMAVRETTTPIVRDAVIQRFEYTYELCWKSVMHYLDRIHGIACRSPKGCYRELLTIGMTSPEETETLLEMADDRNQTVHVYHEATV